MYFKRAEPTLISSNKPLDGHPYALNGLYSQMLYIQLPELALTKLNNASLNKTFYQQILQVAFSYFSY